VNLIVLASSSSFYFSHRVYFFFQSLIINLEDQQTSKELYKKSRMALKGLKDSCLQSKERLYLANSKDLVELIVEEGLAEHYPQL
jgi:hypothetical protein